MATTILSFRTGRRVRLGENIIAIGFPLQGIMSSSINLTTGTVSSLAGLRDDTRIIQFTAPIQPGNSGGPLLDQSRNVVGIVTSKLSPLWAARSIGDLPQNVNFAIKDSVLVDFLDSRGVHYVTGESATRMEATDIAERAEKAVASIQCDRTNRPTVAASTPPPPQRSAPASTIASSGPLSKGVVAYQVRDYATAFKEWRPLAEQGNPAARYNVGLLYLGGQGVPQDYANAVKWFRRSAEQGYSEGQHYLGAMYGAGEGVKRDYVQAYIWLSLCSAAGNTGCDSQRDLIAKSLNRSQLTSAQRPSLGWRPKKEQ